MIQSCDKILPYKESLFLSNKLSPCMVSVEKMEKSNKDLFCSLSYEADVKFLNSCHLTRDKMQQVINKGALCFFTFVN